MWGNRLLDERNADMDFTHLIPADASVVVLGFTASLATGLVEPVGGLLGATAGALAEQLLPWGLAFAAGAMLFVISDEIIPETHRRGSETHATFSLMVGFSVMMFLDVTLG